MSLGVKELFRVRAYLENDGMHGDSSVAFGALSVLSIR